MKNSQTIDLDFYVPVKDGEPFIAECLESILRQTLQPKRIVVYVNMNSKDKTLEIVERFPVEVRKVWVPLSDARNLAIHELTTDWIGCCDADVILDSQWLEQLWARRSTGAVMITGNTKERIRTVGDLFRSITSPHHWGSFDIDNPYMAVPDQIAQRRKLVDAGGYKTGLINYEDADMCARLRESGHRFYYVASAKAQHWRSDDFITSLGLRYRHSLQRQIDLISSEEGLLQKFKNNMALATANYCKAKSTQNQRLLELCLLLPLHHVIFDIEEAQKIQTPLHEDSSAILQDAQAIVAMISKFQSEEWRDLWNALTPLMNLRVVSKFLTSYREFLTRAIQRVKTSTTYALNDDVWKPKLERALNRAKALTSSDFSKLPVINAENISSTTELPLSGSLYFRQPLLPTAGTFWTCLDLSEYLAQHHRRLIWTETFQGSTVICFEPDQVFMQTELSESQKRAARMTQHS